MKSYYVQYKLYSADSVHGIQVLANTKEEAYDNAVYDSIRTKENAMPYSAWVHSVTYQNGNRREFNTFEGKPY